MIQIEQMPNTINPAFFVVSGSDFSALVVEDDVGRATKAALKGDLDTLFKLNSKGSKLHYTTLPAKRRKAEAMGALRDALADRLSGYAIALSRPDASAARLEIEIRKSDRGLLLGVIRSGYEITWYAGDTGCRKLRKMRDLEDITTALERELGAAGIKYDEAT